LITVAARGNGLLTYGPQIRYFAPHYDGISKSGAQKPPIVLAIGATCSLHCYGGDIQSRNLRKKLAQVSCASFLHQISVQVHASSADDTSNKNGRSWTKRITFSILSVDHSIGTQNFYFNNLNKFKK